MNSPTTFYSCLFLILAVMLCPSDGIAQNLDEIRLLNGSRIEGQIKSATPSEISIDTKGGARKAAVNEIKYVTFSGEPPELTSGRNRILGGKLEQGMADLKKLKPADIKNPMILRDLQFFLAKGESELALSGSGDKGKAINSLLAFVRGAATNFHFFEAADLLGDLSLAQGDYDGAVRYYGAISSKAPWAEVKMQATMSEARALILKGDFATAQQKYELVEKSKSDTKESRRQKIFAMLGRGRCLAETASPKEAIDVIEGVIAENDAEDAELFGRAYNALGDSWQKAGQTKEALMAYLHVDLLYYSDPDIHAESLFHLSKLWDATKNSDRAVAAKKLLTDRYGGSIWAGK